MKNALLFLPAIVFLSIFAFACENEPSSSKSFSIHKLEVPILLDRPEKVQLGTEWDFVQNFYAARKTTLQKNPKDYNALIELAELFIKEARITGEHGHYYPAALKITNQILDDTIKDNEILFRTLTTKAGVQLSLHEFKAALTSGTKAYKINSRNAQICGVMVDCYVELGEYDKAIEMSDRMINIKPDIRSYSRVSYLREIHGDLEGAKSALSLAIKSGYPGYEETAWAMQTLGELNLTYGDINSAKKIFDQIIVMREDYPFAISALGDIAYEENDMKKAISQYKAAIAIIPEVGYYMNLAKAYKKEDQKEMVKSLTDEILEMLADDEASGHVMNLEYSDLYLNILDNPDRALDYALVEYTLRPKNIDVNRLLAKIYLSKEDIEKSIEHTLVASKTDSKHPDLVTLKEKLNI